MAEKIEPLSGTQRAAVLLLSLGEKEAAEVLKHMTAKEVNQAQKLAEQWRATKALERSARCQASNAADCN